MKWDTQEVHLIPTFAFPLPYFEFIFLVFTPSSMLHTPNPRSMVINTRKLWGVTKKVQLITMGTLITMSFQMVLISWVYIWPQNRPKRSLSNLSWNFWVFPVTSSGRNGKQKGGECFCFGNFLALFVLPSLLCAHSHQERENWDKPSLVLITH